MWKRRNVEWREDHGHERVSAVIEVRARYGDIECDIKISEDVGGLCVVGGGFGEQAHMLVWGGKIGTREWEAGGWGH